MGGKKPDRGNRTKPLTERVEDLERRWAESEKKTNEWLGIKMQCERLRAREARAEQQARIDASIEAKSQLPIEQQGGQKQKRSFWVDLARALFYPLRERE